VAVKPVVLAVERRCQLRQAHWWFAEMIEGYDKFTIQPIDENAI
jgi:hypothetical protein